MTDEPPALEDHDVLVYEMTGWGEDERQQLNLLLNGAGIAHEWDGDDLLVPDEEEERVDALMDQVEFPEALEAVEDDGDDEAVYQVVSDLFVISDRLASSGSVDVALAGEFLAAAAALVDMAPPYGVDEQAWGTIRTRAEAVSRGLEDEVDDETVTAEAVALRNLLRAYV